MRRRLEVEADVLARAEVGGAMAEMLKRHTKDDP
jgi:hypothetical protein